MNLLLFAAAQAADPSPHWLEVRTPVDAVSVPDPVDLGWIDDRHHWTVDPSEAFSLDNGPANAALFQLVRDDEPPETLARLTEFLRLPPRMQKILSEGAPADRGAVIAVANADRTAEAFPSASLPPILEALAWAGYSLFVAYCGAAPDGRRRFGTVLRVEGESVERWNDARLIVESAPGRGGLGPTAAVRLSEMPFAAQVLRRAMQQR